MSLHCHVWLPHCYSGRGPAESCARIVARFPGAGLRTTVYAPILRKPLHGSLLVEEAANPIERKLPYRVTKNRLLKRLERRFAAAIDRAGAEDVFYFWPDIPMPLVERAKARGLRTIREMINSPVAIAKPILDEAYRRAEIDPGHGISEGRTVTQTAELKLHDRLFASNPEVEKGLLDLGIVPERIMPTTFGWTAARFAGDGRALDPARGTRFVFVGTINVRKGVPTLLEAWEKAGVDGELVLAGSPEPALQRMVDAAVAKGNVRHLGYVENVGDLYRSCDVFVFPTHEEGGPQVGYEAAGCGLPLITTPMGAARLVHDGETGLVVPPGDSDALAGAMRRLARDAALRNQMGEAARRAAAAFEYDRVGDERARMILA